MSNQRGYYLSDPGDILAFPAIERYGSVSREREEIDIEMEADSGKRYIEKQGTRRIWRLKFLLTPTQLSFFDTLHQAVGGQAIPFYFVLDVEASPLNEFLVRKEKDFKPAPRDQGSVVGGVRVQLHDYTLELTEEIDSDLTITE